MVKRNKLYTADEWNNSQSAQNVDREHHNIFDEGGDVTATPAPSGNLTTPGSNVAWNATLQQSVVPSTQVTIPTSESLTSDLNALKQPIAKNTGSLLTKGFNLKNGPALSAAGSLVNKGAYNLLSGGLSSSAGKGISTVGNAVGGVVGKFNPVAGSIVQAGSGIVGGAVNALWGFKTDQKKLNAANRSIASNANFNSTASTFDGIVGPNAVANVEKPYKGGVFTKGKAKRMNNELLAQANTAQLHAYKSVENNINNIAATQMDNAGYNSAALGGYLPNLGSSGAIDYGFMTDALAAKNKSTETKNKMSSNIFGSLQSTSFNINALGGDIQTNGADWTNGLTHIDAGGSHEENPYEGVQVGVNPQDGKPNLVEEGETIFDDYVFSKRIKVDSEAKKRFHLGKNANVTYADLSKRLEKESLERPNDPISQNALKQNMHNLAEQQERQKAEQQEKEFQKVFESLTPEQQQEIMQQMSMQQQQEQLQAQQAEAQQQMAMEGQGQPQMEGQENQQPQESQQMYDEQMQTQQQGIEPQMAESQMAAYGGSIHKFGNGGDKAAQMKRAVYNLLGTPTDDDFEAWRRDTRDFASGDIDWENILENKDFVNALAEYDPAVGHAIKTGNYDLGAFKAATTPTYNWKPFINNVLNQYDESNHQGFTKGNYLIDSNFGLGKYNSIKDLENSENYKAYTNYMKGVIDRTKGIRYKLGDNPDDYNSVTWENPEQKFSEDDFNALRTLRAHARGTAVNDSGAMVPLWNDEKDGWTSLVKGKDAKDESDAGFLFNKYRTDHKGGIFHFTPEMIQRNAQIKNFEVDNDGNVKEIVGDLPKGWNKDSSYSWQDKNSLNDWTYNYYKKPNPTSTPGKTVTDVEPVHQSTWGRYVGGLGPLVALGMQAAGVGKPKYDGLNSALDIANSGPTFAQYKPIGNYLTYRPMDTWFEQNKLNANARATDRAIMNNSSSHGSKMAGLLANSYNNQIASGNLYRQALEYNDAQRMKVGEFNKDTDKYNATAFTQNSATNAGIANDNRRFRASTALDVAKTKMDADSQWYQGIYGNMSKLFSNISDWGKERAQHNMIADMAADNLFGNLSDKQYIGKGFLRTVTRNKAAKGGRIKRRRGLTF